MSALSPAPYTKLGLLVKKDLWRDLERDEAKRQAFLEQLATIHPDDIVYADEAGMDSRDDYAYGWNQLGERFHAAVFCGGIIPPQINLLKSGRRQGRVNMIAARVQPSVDVPFYDCWGKEHRTVFETWIETCLIGSLKPGQWLVIDNATFHKGGRIEQLIEQAGCKVIYLPPYSPDFNKIEKCWSWLKSRIRQCLNEFDCLRDAMEHILKQSS